VERTEFRVNCTIDCEATQSYVNDPAMGVRSARGFRDVLERYGFKGTFFLIPGDARSDPGFYRELPARGHEVGLHLHPADEGFFEFTGVMGPEEQREVISAAKERWAEAMGFEPRSFCMGYATANDFTYAVLDELGFTHGQVGVPGRSIPETACFWEGSPLDIHYANRYNRMYPGDLDFIDIPYTIDPDSRIWGGRSRLGLYVEQVDAENHWYTIYKAVRRQKDDDSIRVKFIRSVTHNFHDFADPGNFRGQTLIGIIEAVGEILREEGCELVPATMEEMAEEYRRNVPKVDIRDMLKLDRRAYRGRKPE